MYEKLKKKKNTSQMGCTQLTDNHPVTEGCK